MKLLKTILSVLILFSLSLSSCGDADSGGCDPDIICYTQRPTALFAKLQLTVDPSLDSVVVKYYKGNHDDEDNELLMNFITNQDVEYIESPVGYNYSAVAAYYFPDKTVKVYDGHRIRARSFTNCETTCWDWDDIEFELELKE